MTGLSSVAWNASGAPATSESVTPFQSSPDWFCTMPHTCRSAVFFPEGAGAAALFVPSSITRRYEGRHTGVSAT